MMPTLRQALILLICCLPAVPAAADSYRAPKLHVGAPVSIQAYGTQNPACLEWTNGCVLCVKGEDGHASCSTAGIACQPAGLTCKRKAP